MIVDAIWAKMALKWKARGSLLKWIRYSLMTLALHGPWKHKTEFYMCFVFPYMKWYEVFAHSMQIYSFIWCYRCFTIDYSLCYKHVTVFVWIGVFYVQLITTIDKNTERIPLKVLERLKCILEAWSHLSHVLLQFHI